MEPAVCAETIEIEATTKASCFRRKAMVLSVTADEDPGEPVEGKIVRVRIQKGNAIFGKHPLPSI